MRSTSTLIVAVIGVAVSACRSGSSTSSVETTAVTGGTLANGGGDAFAGEAAGGIASGGSAGGSPSAGRAAGGNASGGQATGGDAFAGKAGGGIASGGSAGSSAAGGSASVPAVGGSAGTPASGGAAGTPGTGGSAGETCGDEQRARQDTFVSTYPSTEYSLSELPAVVVDFLLSFLPESYITEHFRFFRLNSSGAPTAPLNLLYMTFEYGCETAIDGQLQWDVPIYDGKIRYIGPSRPWQLLISQADAVSRIESAGCDSSNTELAMIQRPTPIPGVTNEYVGLSFDLGWKAGGQRVTCSGSMPSPECECSSMRCSLNAETGEMETTPAMMGCPA